MPKRELSSDDTVWCVWKLDRAIEGVVDGRDTEPIGKVHNTSTPS